MLIRTNKRTRTENYALKALYAKDKNLNVVKIDKIYYPYAMLVHRIKMKNPNSTMNRKILCVMDMATGRGAIGDVDPRLVEVEVDDVQVVEAQLTEEELYKKAHDFVFRTVLSKVKVLYVPEIVLEKTDFFYKLFYVIQCKDPNEKDYFLMSDAMDGSFTVLDY